MSEAAEMPDNAVSEKMDCPFAATAAPFVVAAPEEDWIPLRAAPFVYQHGRDLDHWFDFDPSFTIRDLDAAFPGSLLFDEEEGVFLVKPTGGHRFADINPRSPFADMVAALSRDTDADPVQASHAAEAVQDTWQTLTIWLQNAIVAGSCVVIARLHRAWNDFSLIPVDVWQSFSVSDWDTGVARCSKGDILFSVHVAKSGTIITPRRIDPVALQHVMTTLPKGRAVSAALKWQLTEHLAGRLTGSSVEQRQRYLDTLTTVTGKRHAAGERTFGRARKMLLQILAQNLSPAELQAVILRLV